MNLELSLEQKSQIIKDALYDDIKEFEKMIQRNFSYHNGDEASFAPLYSWDGREENKKLNKIIKSFIRVYDYHSEVKYERDA